MNWFHRLLNPHCQHCIELDEDNFQKSKFCNTCESLKNENAFLRDQVKTLMDSILHPSVPIEAVVNTEDIKPLNNPRKPFSVIRNVLESADRLKAKQRDEQLLKVAAKPDSAITNDEGKVDINKVAEELNNIDKEIANVN